MKTTFLAIFLGILVISCSTNTKPEAEYMQNMEVWKKSRLENLKSEKGWLNVSGLYWLEEGENSFGSAEDNRIVFPEKSAKHYGIIIKTGDKIEINVNENASVSHSGDAVNKMVLLTDKSGTPTILRSGNFAWFIIKREDKYAIRLRDFDNPNINKLDHIPAYPISTDWIKSAKFIAFDSIRKIEVANMIGGSEEYDCPGKLVFRHKRKELELLPFKAGKGFFIIIGDQTSAIETYAAGRYMYVDAPDENGNVILDFNKAYNPPCAFTDFATCPLPPLENRLNIEITAGEKAVHLD